MATLSKKRPVCASSKEGDDEHTDEGQSEELSDDEQSQLRPKKRRRRLNASSGLLNWLKEKTAGDTRLRERA